jgi:hypothetical protein
LALAISSPLISAAFAWAQASEAMTETMQDRAIELMLIGTTPPCNDKSHSIHQISI